jgi:hypothetical protein
MQWTAVILWLLGVSPVYAQDVVTSDDNIANALLVRATQQVDYSDYRRLAAIIGLNAGELITNEATTSVEPKITSIIGHADLTGSTRTPIAMAATHANFNSVTSTAKDIQRVIFQLSLNSDITCVHRGPFIESFPPDESYLATDGGGRGVSRRFAGANKRSITAYFNMHDCATSITLMQEKRMNERKQ